MLRKSFAALKERLSPGGATGDQGAERGEQVSADRRGFFKKAALGAVSISATAGLAKAVVDSVPEPDLSDLYRKDRLAGEKDLAERDYVLMSDDEKTDMVQTFIDNYHESS